MECYAGNIFLFFISRAQSSEEVMKEMARNLHVNGRWRWGSCCFFFLRHDEIQNVTCLKLFFSYSKCRTQTRPSYRVTYHQFSNPRVLCTYITDSTDRQHQSQLCCAKASSVPHVVFHSKNNTSKVPLM